ncbi:hypothetical protein CANTEDRAFT_116883, partial [Yamadazyma tenuis ATCC 10573]
MPEGCCNMPNRAFRIRENLTRQQRKTRHLQGKKEVKQTEKRVYATWFYSKRRISQMAVRRVQEYVASNMVTELNRQARAQDRSIIISPVSGATSVQIEETHNVREDSCHEDFGVHQPWHSSAQTFSLRKDRLKPQPSR